MDKKTKKFVNSREWEFSSDRRMGFHMMYCFHHCFHVDFPKMFGVKPMSSIYVVKDGVTSFFYIKDEYDNLLKKMIIKLKEDKKFATFLSKYIYERYSMYEKYAYSLNLEKKKLTSKIVLQILNKNKKIEEKMSASFWIIFNAFEKSLTDLIMGEGVDEKDLAILSLSTRKIPLDIYHIDLYKTVLSHKQNDILKLHKKYRHLGVFDFMFDQKTLSFHSDQIKRLTKVNAKNKIRGLSVEYKKREKLVRQVLMKYKNQQHFLSLFRAFADVKEWKNFLREKVNNELKIPMQFVANHLESPLKEVALLSYEEINEFFSSKKVGLLNLHERFNKSMYVFERKKMCISSDAVFIDEFLASQEARNGTSLTGMIAFKGVVRGIVKIVFGESDFKKIEEGDILVASTTRPDFLPVMRKVKGFVTNEGGLLSHATIVSRELKKPCIIGTKIATKVLKDGDLVEVDAEKGVVRVLKKADEN